MTSNSSADPRPHLVILGSGFGAFQCLRSLNGDSYRVTVVSPRNHFLFTPLLVGATVGTVEDRNIIEPIRGRKTGVQFCHAACEHIHAESHTVDCKSLWDGTRFSMEFDRLVVAVGGKSSTFGIEGVEEHALFLKEVSDARAIRRRILGCLERAGLPGTSPQQREQLLHWVIVGGGPTGTEFSAELHDFVRDARKAYPEVVDDVKITLLEATEELLPSFDEALQNYTENRFQREGIEVRVECAAQEVQKDHVILTSGERLPCGMVVWSTGIVPHVLISDSGLPVTDKGFLRTDDRCRVLDHPDIYAIGDTARIEETSLPVTAQLAQQQGRYLGKALSRRAQGKEVDPFQFRNLGTLAYIGEGRALADLPVGSLKGRVAWIFWRSVYFTKLVGLRNKLQLLGDWIHSALFGRDISRTP